MSPPAPSITLHHLNASRSERLFWALEELGLPYDVKVWFRSPVMAPKELKAIHPLGKAPVLVDGGKTLAESGAIIDYLQATYLPTRPPYSIPSSYWSHYSEGTLMLMLQMTTTFNATATMAPWYVRPVVQGFVEGVKSTYLMKQIQINVNHMEAALAKSPTGWFGEESEPSAGDYMLLYPINALLSNSQKFAGVTFSGELRKWMDKVEARPGYQRGAERLKSEERKGRDVAGGKE